jgi:hypothetical protein
MSTRHRIVAITLLSSSIAAASPASPPRPPTKTAHAELAPFIDRAAVRAAVRTSEHRRMHALTDDDGYPLVGNMHGKSLGPPEPESRRVEPRRELALVDPFPASTAK